MTYSYVYRVVLLREKNCAQLEVAFLIFNMRSSTKQLRQSCCTHAASMRNEHCKVVRRGKSSSVIFISVYDMDVSRSTGYKGTDLVINNILYIFRF